MRRPKPSQKRAHAPTHTPTHAPAASGSWEPGVSLAPMINADAAAPQDVVAADKDMNLGRDDLEAWDAWNRKKTQKEMDDIEEQELLLQEEIARVKKDNRDERNGLYGSTSTKSPLTVLRKRTAKVLRHRRAWEDISAAGATYRVKHSGNGGTGFSVVRERTSPWLPNGQFDRPEEPVIVKSGDIAYFFYSALLDSAGPVVRADGVPSGKARDVWIAITAVFYRKDFTELAQRIAAMYNVKNRTRAKYDEFLDWFWDEFVEGLNHVICRRDRGTFYEDVKQNWELVEHALYDTANYLARYIVKFELEASERYGARLELPTWPMRPPQELLRTEWPPRGSRVATINHLR